MDHVAVQCFLTLNEYKNFSTAAYECHMTQSSLSKKIKQLETELGVILFNRSTRQMSLTDAGQIFEIKANQMMQTYKALQSELQPYKLTKDNLKIGGIPILNQSGIALQIANYKVRYHESLVEITELEHTNLMKELNNENLDLVFTRLENIDPTLFEVIPILEDKLVFLCAQTHLLASNNSLNLEMIKDEPLILLGEESGVFQTVAHIFKKGQLKPNIQQTHHKIETILGLVQANFGSTLLMKQSLRCFNHSGIKVIEVMPEVKSQIGMVYLKKKQIKKEVTQFSDYMRNQYKK